MSQNTLLSQIRKPRLAIIGIGLIASAALAFTTPSIDQPITQTDSLYVEPCDVDYTVLNQVTCTAYISIAGTEYQAMIESVDYTYLNDVYVDYVLVEYPNNQMIEKQISDELNAYFDDRRMVWIRGV